MAKSIPATHTDIVEKPSYAHLTTLMPDGSPQASPVWIDRKGDKVVVNSARGRVKDKNMRRDPRVAISLTDPDDPYRFLLIRGSVVEITEDGADEHIDAMAKKYLGKDKYPFRAPGEVRVLYFIEPTSVVTRG